VGVALRGHPKSGRHSVRPLQEGKRCRVVTPNRDSVKFTGGIVWSVKRKFDQVKLSLYTPKQKSSQVLDTNLSRILLDAVINLWYTFLGCGKSYV